MSGIMCCLLAEARKRVTLCFCLSACPRTMPQMHCERPCVLVQGLQILCWVLKSGKWACSLFTITAQLLRARFFTLTTHMLLLHFGTFTVNLVDCPSFDYKCGGNGSCFLNLSTDNWIEPDRKTPEGKRQESLKVNITSSLKPFQRKWDFPYFSMFCLDPTTGEETMADFSFPVDLYTLPKLGKKNWWKRMCLKNPLQIIEL